ncbi:MAG: hypothetical protein AAF559_12200 [Pseudomonadota bacterium]
MEFDLSILTYTPDIRHVDPSRARIVKALRYSHVARAAGDYCPNTLGHHLGNREAVSSFHVFLDETGRAWPEPISLHLPCNPRLSYDEMLLADLCVAATRSDRTAFDEMTQDMLGVSVRNSLWSTCQRLVRHFAPVAE